MPGFAQRYVQVDKLFRACDCCSQKRFCITVACLLFFSYFLTSSNAQSPDVSQSGGIGVKEGGGVCGFVLTPEKSNSSIIEIEPVLGGKISVERSDIRQIVSLKPDQVHYRNFAPLQPDDVDSNLKIARWANKKQLSSLADVHYERVVELEPENSEARKALHHVKVNGSWVSSKERMERSGLERVNGRNVSKQEAELIHQADENKTAARFWKKEIKSIFQGARNGDQRRREALRSVRNPVALSPIVNIYRELKNDPEGRVLLIQAMSSIGTPAALSELGKIALSDPDAEARAAAVDGIYRRKTASADAVEYFKRGLRSDDPITINNAAYALERLQADSAIPNLINALVTAHKRQIVVGSEQTGATFDGSGRVSSFSPGGGGRMKTVTELSRNEAVHRALVKIVGAHYPVPVDFGFNVDEWIRWRRQVDQLADFYPRRDR